MLKSVFIISYKATLAFSRLMIIILFDTTCWAEKVQETFSLLVYIISRWDHTHIGITKLVSRIHVISPIISILHHHRRRHYSHLSHYHPISDIDWFFSVKIQYECPEWSGTKHSNQSITYMNTVYLHTLLVKYNFNTWLFTSRLGAMCLSHADRRHQNSVVLVFHTLICWSICLA